MNPITDSISWMGYTGADSATGIATQTRSYCCQIPLLSTGLSTDQQCYQWFTAKLNCVMDTYLSSSTGQGTEATHSVTKWSLSDRFMSKPDCIFCHSDGCKKVKKTYWASQSQMSHPLIHRRKSWSCFKLLKLWLQFLHHQIQIWIGALLSKMCFLDFLTPIWVTENAVGVGHKYVTQRPFRSWMSSLSALTNRTG